MDFSTLAADPLAFVRSLTVATGTGSRPFADVMADFQTADFEALAPSLLAVAAGEMPPTPRYWIERTKGGSKDSDLACCLLFLLATAARPLRIQIAANDAEQADEVRLVVKGLLKLDGELNEILAGLIEVKGDRIVNKASGSEAQILTRDSRGHGARPDVLIVNELTHIADEEFAATCFDNLDKMPSGLGIVACNAGFVGSWQADWKTIASTSDRWHVSELTEPAPWIGTADLEESQKRNPPTRFNRLWHGVWAGEGDALDPALISAAFCLDAPHHRPKKGFSYVLGVDLGITRDSAAAALLGVDLGYYKEAKPDKPKPRARVLEALEEMGYYDAEPTDEEIPDAELIGGTRQIELARLQLWKPNGGRVALMQVEEMLVEWSRRFNVVKILADQWQAALLIERLVARGLPAVGVAFTGNVLKDIASATLSAFQERRLRLFAHEQLERDCRALRAVEKSYGVRLESPRGPDGHGDSATALGLGLTAVRTVETAPPTRVDGPLVCWP